MGPTEGSYRQIKKGISYVQPSHRRPVVSATFDEPNLVSAASLVSLVALTGRAGLRELTDERMSVPTDKGSMRA